MNESQENETNIYDFVKNEHIPFPFIIRRVDNEHEITSKVFPDLLVKDAQLEKAFENTVLQVEEILDSYRKNDNYIPESFYSYFYYQNEMLRSKNHYIINAKKSKEKDLFKVQSEANPDLLVEGNNLYEALADAYELSFNAQLMTSAMGFVNVRSKLGSEGTFQVSIPIRSKLVEPILRHDILITSQNAIQAYKSSFIPLIGIFYFFYYGLFTLYDVSMNKKKDFIFYIEA